MDVSLLFEKHLTVAINPSLTAYCDQHDLIAVVTKNTRDQQEEVVIYRINGEIAFRIPAKVDDDEVSVLNWKPDGRFLGIGWKKFGCGVYDGESGKLLSSTGVVERKGVDDWKLDLNPDFGGDEDYDEVEVACIGWAEHTHPASYKRRKLSHTKDDFGFTDDDDTARNGRYDGDQIRTASSLADTIGKLDVTSVIPRLSALPAHGLRSGPDGSKFATQMSIDGIFTTASESSDTIDTLIAAGSTGFVNVLLNDSVKIGSHNLRGRFPKMHSSHRFCSSQVVVSELNTSDDADPITHSVLGEDERKLNYYLHYIDVPLERLGGSLLNIVATNTKRIQNLVEYITQTVRCIQNDFNSNLQLPRRLMNSISEELSEKEEGDVVLNLYQLALTGSFTPTMLEWLRDIVKETNHKRWDQSINNLYTHILDHLFANLVPALDRLSIAASTLRGHAKLHEGSGEFVPSSVFTALLDDIEALKLVAQKMQLVVVTEHRQFRAFSKWMRTMIEISVAGPGSKGAIETEEREMPNLDYSSLLAYIKDTMIRSKLSVHFEDIPELKGKCSKSEFFQNAIIAGMGRDNTIEAVRKLDDPTHSTQQNEQPAQINIAALTTRLAGQARSVMELITTTWQKQMLPTFHKGTPIKVHTSKASDIVPIDLKLIPHHNDRHKNIAQILLKDSATNSELHAQRISRGQNSTEVLAVESAVRSYDGHVLDAKIIGDTYVAVLLNAGDLYRLLIHESTEKDNGFEKRSEFEFNAGFKPRSLVVGGREGKKVCVVFDDAGLNWKVFSLSELVGP